MPLPFDNLILTAIAAELRRDAPGAVVEKVHQPAPADIVLRLFHNGVVRYLLLSADPALARVHFTVIRRDDITPLPPFGAVLRKHLTEATLTDITLPFGFGERVLHVHFRTVDERDVTLVAETQGRHANVVLVGPDGVTLGAAKLVGSAVNRVRQTLPGIPYSPPPVQMRPDGTPRVDPAADFTPETDAALSPAAAKSFLMDTWAGVSPLLAKEVLARAAQAAQIPLQAPLTPQVWGEDALQQGHVLQSPLGQERSEENALLFPPPKLGGPGGPPSPFLLTPAAVHKFLREMVTDVQNGRVSPVLWTTATGDTVGAYPLPLHTVPVRQQHTRETLSVALDNAAASLGRTASLNEARASLLTALNRAIGRREREREELDTALVNAARADEWQQAGDLLLASPHALTEGQETVELPDWYAPLNADGTPAVRTVAVNPALSVRENAELFYARARKSRAALETLARRRDAAVDELLRLSAARTDAESTEREDVLANLRRSVSELLAREGAASGGSKSGDKGSSSPFGGFHIRAFQSPDGWDIWVGEDAAANDFLTGKLARPYDVWMHARQAASAHAVVRVPRRGENAPLSTLLTAAELVAARSAVKHSSLVPVDYTLKKYVRKPRGSAPGAAVYDHEKTLHVSGIHG